MQGDIREKLTEALSRVDRPGSFCVSGGVAAVPPGLDVEGLGPVGLPLTARKAKELIRQCHQAPHGRGDKTVVDPSVRRAWKLAPGRFSLTNPDWDRLVREAIAEVQEGLGLEKQKLEGHLHDLLLYGPGDFFLPHRDGEKLDRMVATLVIALPSAHEGGELVVRHDGQERSIDLRGGDDPSRVPYAAFYADCEHEIRPITKGYRLCLVYNLTLAKSRKKAPTPPDSGPVGAVGRLLEEWSAGESAGKLAVTLEHQYTQDGLTWDALKGEDRTRARVLREAARRSGCVASLALLTLYESGEGEEYRPRSRYGRRREYDDDDGGDGEYRMGEVYETRLTAAPRVTGEGQMLPIGELTVEEDEVLDPDSLKEVTPEEEFEGYTGNEGMTLERWYRHAAVVLWPGRRHFEVICERDSRQVIPVLKDRVALWKQSRGEHAAALKAQGLELAAAILAKWKRPADLYASWSSNRHSPAIIGEPKAGDLLEALDALGEPGLIGRFAGDLMIRDTSVDPGKALAATCQKYGWGALREPLRALMQGTTSDSMERNVRLLESFCAARPRKKEGWGDLCSTLGEDLVAAIEAIDRTQGLPDWSPRKIDRGEALAGLARSLLATDQRELLARFVAHALAAPKKYPLAAAHVPALVTLRPWIKKHVKEPVPALARWVASCREQLESLTAKIPQEPTDYRRAAQVRCQCAECVELKRFLEDPNESVHRFRAREKVRDHLAREIREHKLDLDLATDRGGSPYTLVCTKNVASYRERLRTYHENLEHLATLRSIEGGLPGRPAP